MAEQIFPEVFIASQQGIDGLGTSSTELLVVVVVTYWVGMPKDRECGPALLFRNRVFFGMVVNQFRKSLDLGGNFRFDKGGVKPKPHVLQAPAGLGEETCPDRVVLIRGRWTSQQGKWLSGRVGASHSAI